MKILLALLFLSVAALGEPSSDQEQGKPALIQDGPAAESYISTSLYDYLDKPPYLAIRAETRFISKRIDGKSVWVALVDFYCGVSEQNKLHCLTIIVYDPITNTHWFMNPDNTVEASDADVV
jgi:hypothetical protein